MDKIANTTELRTELTRLAAQCVPGMSRQAMADELQGLVHRLATAKVPEDYADAKKQRNELEAEVDRTGKALKAVSGGGAFNTTPDDVKATAEWKKANREYSAAFKALQDFNEVYVRRFKKEIQKDRRR